MRYPESCTDYTVESCTVVSHLNGVRRIECDVALRNTICPPAVCGRRPDGLTLQSAASSSNELGGLFAEMSALEAASVYAFRTLHRELRELGAPRRLRRAASRAARDEIAHTRVTRRLARRFATPTTGFAVPPPRRRTLFEIARENAVEGCVRETFGALVATHQASAARDREIQQAMMRIARDETEHAALARRLNQYLLPRLSPAERSALRAARAEAIGTLSRELARCESREAVANAAGEPSPAVLRELFNQARVRLWNECLDR
jgi:hypothetical protein